jgi:hypothetical protein
MMVGVYIVPQISEGINISVYPNCQDPARTDNIPLHKLLLVKRVNDTINIPSDYIKVDHNEVVAVAIMFPNMA